MRIADLVKTEPYQHQQVAFLRLKKNRRFGLFMEQGTGKTLPAIAAVGYRIQKDKVRRIMVVCPRSVIPEWEIQLDRHANFPYQGIFLEGKMKDRRKQFEKIKSQSHKIIVLVMSFETMRTMEPELTKWRPEMIVIDESQKIKNAQSKQSKAAFRLGKKAKVKIIMTGTPWHESPLDLYSQIRFLEPQLLGRSFNRFRDTYAIMGGYMGYEVKGYRDLPDLQKKIAPYVYIIKKEDCLELPETIDQTIHVDLAGKQLKAYQEMLKESIYTLKDGGVVEAELVLTQIIKLQQITGGFIQTEDKKIVRWPSAKEAALKELLEDLPHDRKIIIFCKFLPEIKQVAKLCKSLEIKYATFHGATENRGKILRAFQQKDNPRVLIAQIRTGGVGITLTAANYVIYYSLTHSYLDYDQSRARVDRIGQTRNVTFLHLVAPGTIDEDIFLAVKNKEQVSGLMHRLMERLKLDYEVSYENSVPPDAA